MVITLLQLQGLLKFQEEAGFVPPKKHNGYGEHTLLFFLLRRGKNTSI
jgi:hypothetical protein